MTPDSQIVFDPVLPTLLIGLLGGVLLVAAVFLHWRTGATVRVWQRGLLVALRLAGLAGVVALLLQPSRLERIPPPTVEKLTLVALDQSRSMKSPDASGASRFEAAALCLTDAGLVTEAGTAGNVATRIHLFADDARPMTGRLTEAEPAGDTTRFHQSLTTVLGSLGPGQGAHALIVLSDGHDFELVNPTRTGLEARLRQIPIYAVPVGGEGRARDVAVRIVSFLPFTYVKQKARIQASLRLVGCEFEELQIQLLRQGELVQTRRVNAEEHLQLPVEFEVEEPATGQFEYEVSVSALDQEVNRDNNSAITYLNVIDQKVRVLVLEGDPYWDTTFLQRSLMRNDKMSVDSLVKYTKSKVRRIRSEERPEELQVPATLEEWSRYDLVVLGRSVEQLLDPQQLQLLEQWVQQRGGAVVFSRGPAFNGELAGNTLEPVIWKPDTVARVKLEVTREGRSLAPFRLIQNEASAGREIPELLAVRAVEERKPLTATLAGVSEPGATEALPGIVHRRHGSGQVVSVGVEGLWRWAFNAKIEGVNTLFDRFWDQLAIWLMAGRDVLPDHKYSFRTSSANLMLGEKIHLRASLREADPGLRQVPVTLFHRDTEVGRVQLHPDEAQPGSRLVGEFLPETTGRYRATARFPDGSTQDVRFIVFSENLEETEIAADRVFLRRLCESSGGRLLQPAEVKPLLDQLVSEPGVATPKTRKVSLWDRAWVWYMLGALFGLDWYLRRKWGLC